MAIFKCKMCGGTLEINAEMSVGRCEYCGTEQTLPKSDDEQILTMINRANHFRQQCEFDKAMDIYEKVMARSEENNAEVYWSVLLCRYGIEYVDDPLTRTKKPTCHRTQYRSILDDPDYATTIQLSDPEQRNIYEAEARTIDAIQKEILEISNKEEPFDVFICYKENDDAGQRTKDSVIAQDIYYQLVEQGYKVFFSRITLEDKLGTAYEPYIFAALNSAKVMVVVGTEAEYFQAVWVRNEWSRFLSLMQDDKSKTIIPAYKDIDPYDLPDELSYFQAQDMSKIGFMQDLIRGIVKVANKDDSISRDKREIVSETINSSSHSGNTDALIKRGYMSLEDSDWEAAARYFEQVLNQDAECAEAYIGLAFMQNKCCDWEGFRRNRISIYQSVAGEISRIKLSDSKIDELIHYAEEMCIVNGKRKVEALLKSEGSYDVFENVRKEQLKQEENYFENDRYIKRIRQFADGDVLSKYDDARNYILGELNSLIQSAINDDRLARENAMDGLARKIEKLKESLQEEKGIGEELNRVKLRINDIRESIKATETIDQDSPYKEEYEKISGKISDLQRRKNDAFFLMRKDRDEIDRQIDRLKIRRQEIDKEISSYKETQKIRNKQKRDNLEQELTEWYNKFIDLNGKWAWVDSGETLDSYTGSNDNIQGVVELMDGFQSAREILDYFNEYCESHKDPLSNDILQVVKEHAEYERWYGNQKEKTITEIKRLIGIN